MRSLTSPTEGHRLLGLGRACVSALVLALAVLSCLSCATGAQPPERPLGVGDAGRTFSASLYPYIPDSGGDNFASLVATLENWFETANPEIDLVLTMDPNVDLYDFATLTTLLGSGSGSVNMLEVDTLLLGELVAQNLVQPLPFSISGLGLFPTALAAGEVSSTTYAVPTYLCGNYVYSWDADIAGVSTGQGLIDFLSQHPSPTITPLVGNFQGSWTLPGFYVDAWADTHSNDYSQLPSAYQLPLDEATMAVFPSVVDLCGDNGGPCLAGTYKDNQLAETLFAQNRANGFVGFSERLFFILEAREGDVNLPSVISAPVGVGSKPVMFVDGLVLNTHCADECADDAATFSAFMSSLEVRNLIAFSLDSSDKTFPRYLLQALESFYTSAPGNQNLIYQQLRPFVLASAALPNSGFPEARLELNPALETALTGDLLQVAVLPESTVVHGVTIRRAPARFPSFPERR